MIVFLSEGMVFAGALILARAMTTGYSRSIMKYSAAYAVIIAVSVWLTDEIKWMLLGGIVFMLIAASYATWNLYKQMSVCLRQMKKIDKTNK